MNLLHPHSPLIQSPIHSRRNSQRPADNRTNTSQETRERLRPRLPVDNFHRGNVIVEEHAGDAALRVDALLVAFCRVVAAHECALVRCYGVLVRFNRALVAVGEAVRAQGGFVVGVVDGGGEEGVPAEREVGS